MIIVRCKECGTELKGDSQTKSCGCPNMLTVTGDTFTARNLTSIVIVKSNLPTFSEKENIFLIL